MKTIQNILFNCVLLLATLMPVIACSDWNDPEPVDLNSQSAQEQDPELWARYMQVLHNYKQSKHFITYARFDNGAEKPVNEGNYLRSLPDSLDIVVLSNPDNITAYDREDIPLLQEKSTRVLYLVDYAAQANSLPDAAQLSTYLDKAIAAAAELKLDGFAFTHIPLYGGTEAEQTAHKEKLRLIITKLSTGNEDQLLIMEGDPASAEAADLEKLNYVVLNTAALTNVTDLKLQVTGVLTNGIIPKDKLLLAAQIGNTMTDEAYVKQDAVELMTNRVMSLGPLAGLGIYAIGDDYYNAKMNYEITRTAIQQMNPAK